MSLRELLDVVWPHDVCVLIGDYDKQNENRFQMLTSCESSECYRLVDTSDYFAAFKINDVYAKDNVLMIEVVPRERPRYLKQLRSEQK